MAVNNNNGQTTLGDALQSAGVTQASVATGAAPRATGAAGNAPRARATGPINLNSILSRPIPRLGASEVASKFLAALQKDYDEKIKAKEIYRDFYQLHLLDNTNLGIPLPLIAMVMTQEHNGQKHAGVFTFVVAGGGNKLSNRFLSYGQNQQVEIDVVPGDVINEDMWNVVKSYLGEQYGSDVNFHNSGAAVLPREMSPDDAGEIARAVYNASQALYTVLENQVTGGEEPFNLAMIKGLTLQASVDLNPAPVHALGGLPVRNDIGVSLNYLTRVTGLAGGGDVVEGLTRVAGYIDLEYVGPAQPQQAQMGYNPYMQAVPTQQFIPRYVITDLDTRINAITPETVLLGLITAGMVGQHLTWVRQFEPRMGLKKGEEDLRDIGALGYVVNFGSPDSKPEKVPTHGAFSQQDLFNLVTFAVYDRMIVSMDIEETGTLAWLHQAFIAAANGSQAAYDLIVNASDNLTNGHFKTLWKNGPIVRDDANRVHLGYYIDKKDGERHDLREIDRLAILNLFGGRDPDVVATWDRSWLDMNVPLDIRTEMRAKILKNMLAGVEITGFARRVSFTEDFIVTLTTAAAQAGLVIQQTNMLMVMQSGVTRPVYDANGVALQGGMGYNGGGVFTMGGGQGYGSFRGGSSAFTGRFGFGQ